MTPFSAPGAGAKPSAATPRAQGAPTVADAPRPVMGSYGNLGTPVRVAPSPTPRMQAPPTARTPGVPMNPPRDVVGAAFQAARPRMPVAPTAGVPRPMVNLGGAQMTAAPSLMPRMQMQAGMPTARAPGIPQNAHAVGPAVQSARPQVTIPAVQSARPQVTMPLSQPTHRAPAVANPAVSSQGKRAPTTMGPAAIPQAKRHAPMQRPQGAPTGGVPLPTNPAAVPAVGVRAPVPPQHAQGAPTGGNATPSQPPLPQPNLPYIGVYRDPSKGWMARVTDMKRCVARAIGPFDDPHLAALAHDRVAIACAGRGIGVGVGAQINFEPAFYRVETAFLHRWEGDICDSVEKGEYEKIYENYLEAGYKAALNVDEVDEGGEQITESVDELITRCYDAELFWDTIEEFFLDRAGEIGEKALKVKEDGKDDRNLLRNRFVEMYKNKSLCPKWRRENYDEKLKTMMIQNQQQQKIQMQQQQQQQIQLQHQQQQQLQQIQMHQRQQRQIQMQQQIQLQQQQQQIQMRQQQEQQQRIQIQQQMMIQKQRQQQLMMTQQQEQQQHLDDDAKVQVKPELS